MRRIGLLCACMLGVVCMIFGSNPRKVTLLGQDFYYHTAQKNESLYGIALQHGWNPDTLAQYNELPGGKIESGMRIFYPASQLRTGSKVEIEVPEAADIAHKVVKGETVYSVSRLYGVTPDQIYLANPKSRNGIKIGEVLTIPGRSDLQFVKVKPGDTLYSLSNQYASTVEDVLRANPGLTANTLRAGSVIRIPAGSAAKHIEETTVVAQRVGQFRQQKVDKNDTYTSLARRNGLATSELLVEANESAPLKKNHYVAIPDVVDYETTETVLQLDPRAQSADGRKEIYREVHGETVADTTAGETADPDADIYAVTPSPDTNGSSLTPLPEEADETDEVDQVEIAVLLENPSSKKDLDFMRGFLLALDRMKQSGSKVHLSVVDGTKVTSYDDVPALGKADLIIATHDKNFPEDLVNFGNRQHIEVLNVFDVKNELYIDHPAAANLLTPSNYFNDAVGEYFSGNFHDQKFVLVGALSSDDVLTNTIVDAMGSKPIVLTVDEYVSYQFDDLDDVLVYALPVDRASVVKILNATAEKRNAQPALNLTLAGKPNWVVFAESLRDKLGQARAIVPSRAFFDTESYEGKAFLADFKQLYGHAPQNSFPMYSVMGYDVARYFIPVVEYNEGDFNGGFPRSSSTLQTDFNLIRLSNWSGFINPACYILQFNPDRLERLKID